MPTGSGKSLTYQFPAYVDQSRITLVVSPIKALMNQHAEFPGAVTFNSDTDFEKRPEVWAQLKKREKFILLVSPEMLASRHKQIARLPIGRFVIDEVHCLSDWGHDFRPHYWWVSHFLRVLERERGGGRIPRLLLTATANEHVIEDIVRHFPEVADVSRHVRAPLGRPELVLSGLEVSTRAKRLAALVKFLKRQQTRKLPPGTPRRGIVFNYLAVADDDALPKDDSWLRTNQVVAYLRRRGFKKTFPFATRGMKKPEKDATIAAFENASPRSGQATIVVATTAFGMGMDYAGVPFACHLYPSSTISEYWQQVGRAGRGLGEGAHAETLVLYANEDEAGSWDGPALDGLVNAFTIPLHAKLYTFKQSGFTMSLQGPGGGTTQFAMVLRGLQDAGIVSTSEQQVKFPRGMVRFTVNTKILQSKRGRAALDELRQKYIPKKKNKKLRKVFRYFEVAARSVPGKYVLLDQTDYKADRWSTVLQRLNRWVDLGLLERDDKRSTAGEIRLRKSGGNLSDAQLKKIQQLSNEWNAFQARTVKEAFAVARAGSPAKRRRLVQKHFNEPPHHVPLPDGLPDWLKH